MIDHSLSFFQSQLNNYIQTKTGGQKEDIVQFPEIQLPKELIMHSNAVTALLINLEEERLFRSGATYTHSLIDGSVSPANPDLLFSFNLLFVANFKDYIESVKMLSFILQFFHSTRRFDSKNSPALNEGIEQLSTELVNLSFMEQGELWRSLEMPCSPSALYKVRMLVFPDMTMDRIEVGQRLGAIQTITSQQ